MSNVDVLVSKEERQAQLDFWLEKHEFNKPRLAKLLGVTGQFIKVMLTSDTIPTKRREQLIALGIPEEFVPPAYKA